MSTPTGASVATIEKGAYLFNQTGTSAICATFGASSKFGASTATALLGHGYVRTDLVANSATTYTVTVEKSGYVMMICYPGLYRAGDKLTQIVAKYGFYGNFRNGGYGEKSAIYLGYVEAGESIVVRNRNLLICAAP